MTWFYEEFGFNEHKTGSFQQVRNKFRLIEDSGELSDPRFTPGSEAESNDEAEETEQYDPTKRQSPSSPLDQLPTYSLRLLAPENRAKVTRTHFHVGKFSTPSVGELLALAEECDCSNFNDAGGLTFVNICGSADDLHMDPSNKEAVFQVASQFNCLEMMDPGVSPEDGITRYLFDRTQGPVCAMACPAATLFRNYFAGQPEKLSGQANGNQIDNMARAGALVGNDANRYWQMKNGYLMPLNLGPLGDRLFEEQGDYSESLGGPSSSTTYLIDAFRKEICVGIHWDAEVAVRRSMQRHRVCQVFSSAVPIAYARTTSLEEWEPLARVVLEATYLATLAAAKVKAHALQRRVQVYLTCVGGGAFGNPSSWIKESMQRALFVFRDAPLDVRLVHFGRLPSSRDEFMQMQESKSWKKFR